MSRDYKGAPLPDEITEEIRKKVQDKIGTATQTPERTTAWEAIQLLLVEHKLALMGAQLPCDQVGVHPENRNRFGVGGTEAQKHGKDVLTEGFSWKKASDAACFDCPPPPLDAEHKAFNRAMCDQSQGIIPPLSMLTALSVGGSHTNTFCRQVKACVTSVVDGLESWTQPQSRATGRPSPRQLTRGCAGSRCIGLAPMSGQASPH